MSVSMYEGQVRRYRAEIEKQQTKRAAAEKKLAGAEAGVAKYEREAARASSASSASSKLRQADSKRKEAERARADVAKASGALADAQKRLHEAERKLSEARERDERARTTKANRERERLERRRREQEHRRESEFRALKEEHAALVSQVQSLPVHSPPEKVTVLFVGATPDDEAPLHLDREVAEIQRRLRMTKHRDSVDFKWRPAARAAELLQYLNEDNPDIVHFSGHSDQHGLAFEGPGGESKLLDAAQLANLLTVESDRIRLVVFNSCESSGHAEMACDFVEAAIGMETSIEDPSAKTFAGQFYNSLGFGKSLKRAFDQARLQMEIEHGSVSGDPQLHVAAGLDPDEIFLVAGS